MARKTVYERINDVKGEIAVTEEKLSQLNLQLKDLCAERDALEAKQLFKQMKEQGLDIKMALNMLKK